MRAVVYAEAPFPLPDNLLKRPQSNERMRENEGEGENKKGVEAGREGFPPYVPVVAQEESPQNVHSQDLSESKDTRKERLYQLNASGIQLYRTRADNHSGSLACFTKAVHESSSSGNETERYTITAPATRRNCTTVLAPSA